MTLLILIHALIFLAFWLSNQPYQMTLNNFLIGATGWKVNFLLVFLLFAGLVGLWSAARLILRRYGRRGGPAWPYAATGVFFMVFFYGSFIFLFVKNPAQLYRLGQLLQYFRLVIDASLLLLLAWGLRRWIQDGRVSGKWYLLAGLLVLWLVPIFWTPGNVYRGALPEKPRVIAHRGASALAPENTLASMRVAAELGVYGLETDIAVSIDGVLVLLHDANLARTTDVAKHFSGREYDPIETFTWDQLSMLDAGSWFDGRQSFSGEHIPTLPDVLPLIKDNGLYFIYDLRIPADGHPYAGQAIDLCLKQIGAAGIADRTWVLTQPDAIARIRSTLPNAILAAGIGYTDIRPSPEALVAGGYQVVNSVYSLPKGMIHAYQQAGLWVNLWVVDDPWQYASLWLAGVDSVTSNNAQDLVSMPRPMLALPYGIYLLVWGCLGMAAAVVVWWKARG